MVRARTESSGSPSSGTLRYSSVPGHHLVIGVLNTVVFVANSINKTIKSHHTVSNARRDASVPVSQCY